MLFHAFPKADLSRHPDPFFIVPYFNSYTVLCVFCHSFRPLHENVKCCVLAAQQGFRFLVAFERTSVPTQLSVQEILAVFFLGIKRPECETSSPSPSSAEAKNALSDISYRHFIQFGVTAFSAGLAAIPICRESVPRRFSLTLWRLTTHTHIYIYRTAQLTSRRCILNIYSTNILTEYFKHAAHSPFFFSLSSRCRLFHNAIFFCSCNIHILNIGCAKI